MVKYKVCPICGEKNPPNLLECQNDGVDLSGIRVVDEESEKTLKKDDVKPNTSHGEMVRICECGAQNNPQDRKCTSCGEDISDIQPVMLSKEQCYSLASPDGSYAFAITKPIHIIGRENDMSEYLKKKPYVSRTHAKFTLVENELYITNVSKTNFTYVNNEKLEDDVTRLLDDGDEIGLGGIKKDCSYQEKAAYFIVRKCSC